LIRGDRHIDTLLNLSAASFVLISLLTEFNLASALIQISWIVISITGLTRMWLLNRRLRFSTEERRFLDDQFADLPLPAARLFLDAGSWLDLPDGYELLTENAPVTSLYYISSGAAHVTSGGKSLAQVNSGFLGEINVLSTTPASATVVAEGPLRVFAISGSALRRLRDANTDFRRTFDSTINRDTGRKLVAAIAKLVAQNSPSPAL